MTRRQAGQVVYLMAFAMAVLLGAAGLAVDTGFGYYYSSQGDTSAIAAADGGAQLLPDLGAARGRALILVRANGFDPGAATVDVDATDGTRLVVTVRKTFPVLLIRVLGAGPTVTVVRTATSGAPLGGAIVPPASPPPLAPTKVDVPIPFQWCSNPGQLCDAIFSTTITTGPTLHLQFTPSPAHCSDGRGIITLDGTVVRVTSFLAGGQASALEDFGIVTPGPHRASVQFEGRVSGCNTVGPGAWLGTLTVYSS